MNEAETDPRAFTLGGNYMYGVPFPVVIGDRYIHLRKDGPDMVCQVWRWDQTTRTAVREPDPGEAGSGVVLEPVAEGGLGVRLTGEAVGDFTGTVSLGGVFVVADQHGITVLQGDREQLQLAGNQFNNLDIGLKVDATGGIGLGGGLPEGFKYQIDYVNRRIRLAELVQGAEDPVIRNARFSHCRIEGPAVIAGFGLTMISNRWNMLGAPRDSLQIDLPNPEYPYGVIVLENVDIHDSEIVNVAFVTPPAA